MNLFSTKSTIYKRYRLRKICKAIGINPYRWQKDYALGKTDTLNAPEGRATGKTTAVMLRLLLTCEMDVGRIINILKADPDFILFDRVRTRWYHCAFEKLVWTCAYAHIPVRQITFYPRIEPGEMLIR